MVINSADANFLSIFSGVDQNINELINDIILMRNKAILDGDIESLKILYNLKTVYGTWAYEHQVKKINYLQNWAEKQGIKFTAIDANITVRKVDPTNNGYTLNFSVFTKYTYVYINDLNTKNYFKMGTYHSMDIIENGDYQLIDREWYTDPFADSSDLNKLKTEQITNYILSGKPRDFTELNERRQGALDYADKYCGGSVSETVKFIYNNKYKNYNYSGGDCANFASQVLHEGGKFKKNYTWGYQKEGSKAWVNADALKQYLLYSGRASLVAQGSYTKVLKASYLLQPGDIIAYGKKGEVKHVSIVTGADSKGYTLVNCHNADRFRVPWDLGWGDEDITFWLIHVHY